jgi:hypothetical protein
MSTTRSITLHVPLTIRRPTGRKTIVRPEGAEYVPSTPARADPAMVKALARAFRWRRLLESQRYATISEIAAAEKIDRGYVGSILRLTLLAPDIIQRIPDGRQPDTLGLPALLKPFPLEWDKQRTTLLGTRDTARSSSPCTSAQTVCESARTTATCTSDNSKRAIQH